MPLYKLNQYGSGVLGLAGLILWYAKLKTKNQQVIESAHLKMAFIIYACSILCFVLAAKLLLDAAGLSYVVVRSAIGLINGIAIGSVIYACCVRRKSHTA
ncbi:MAG: DUF4184 family protein [Rheinheimera sp.]|nr:DUF4184 family protein [Rheinheimera sp.]